MKIVTFGSCLSRLSALALTASHPGRITSMVYHNRADVFVERWIKKTAPFPSRELFNHLDFLPGEERKGRIIFENQIESGIGRHSLKERWFGLSKPNFFKVIDRKIDLIVLDNYVDLVGKQLLPRNGEGGSVFLAGHSARNTFDLYEIEEKRQSIDVLTKAWREIIGWLRQMQPSCPIVFLNFPFHQHPSAQVARRSQQFAEAFKAEGIITVPNMQVHDSLIKDRSHFAPMQYALYAGILMMACKKPEKLYQTDDKDMDHLLRQ